MPNPDDAQDLPAAGSYVDWQLARFAEMPDAPALVWQDKSLSFAALADLVAEQICQLDRVGVAPGDSVAVVADYSPRAVATLLALTQRECILVPLSSTDRAQHSMCLDIAEADVSLAIDSEDQVVASSVGARRGHPLLGRLRETGTPGLVLFSSGSSGAPKGVLHALPPLLEKFTKPRHRYRTVSFLLFDHIGGVNTLFYTLANLGCLVVPAERSVKGVCTAIERHRAELLPATPSFLNLLLLAEAGQTFDLSTLELITYGTEVMPERTLARMTEVFPGVKLKQTYGLTELGILRSRSAANDSLLVELGGEDFETRIVDGRLFIRARSSMLGYLNADNPFDAEGWFDTGDQVVEQEGFVRICGRVSDVINVAGQKVFPAEVEQVIAEVEGVHDVAVFAEQSLLLGECVAARIQMLEPRPATEMKAAIVRHCRGRLKTYMLPTRISVTRESPVGARFKKVRR